MTKQDRRDEVNAKFGGALDAYTELGSGNTILDSDDLAVVLTGADNLQLFIPEGAQISERGMALIECYNAMCRDRIGTVDEKGRPLPDNEPYQGFTEALRDKMLRIYEPLDEDMHDGA